MGKKTLFHPVSLYIIRGSGLHGGFSFGRITQTDVDSARNCAEYRAEIIAWPEGFESHSQAQQQAILNGCFSSDVWITWCGKAATGKLMCDLTACVVRDDESSDSPEVNADLEDESNA